MKIKEAAEKTGLTEKAIRLYEDKGLIAPPVTEKGGRKFRDYDAVTVEELNTIAGLRRSFFSLEQIAKMQENPDEIPAVFDEYLRELREQYAKHWMPFPMEEFIELRHTLGDYSENLRIMTD